jgi:hypothetical protein
MSEILLVSIITIGYFLFGFLFTIIVNKITPLDGIDGVFFWPIMMLLLVITGGLIILKFILDKLNISNDIDTSLYGD